MFLTDTSLNSDTDLWGWRAMIEPGVPDGTCPHVGIECALWAIGCRLEPCGCESWLLSGRNKE